MNETSKSEPLLNPALIAQLERMELVSRKIFRGRMKGERRSRRKGQSVEFADFRNYVPGDDLRFIDWNLYARLDKLFLKLFLEEEDLHFYGLIDVSHSMEFGEPTKLRYAKQLAAALGYIGLCRSDRVRIQGISASANATGPVLRGRQSLWRLMEHLEGIEADSQVTLTEGIRDFCLRNSSRGILVLISDLMDKSGYEEALKYLVSRDFDIYVIHVLSQEEIAPELTGDLKLVDCEDGDVTEITVSRAMLDRYERTLAQFIDGAKQFCSKRGIVYMMTSTAQPLEMLIGKYLRQRGLLR